MALVNIILLLGACVFVDSQLHSANLQSLGFLFERFAEPLFFPKGDNDEFNFVLPTDFVPERFRKKANALKDRAGTSATAIAIASTSMPDMTVPMQLDRREQYSHFLPKHRRMTRRLIEIFMSVRTVDEFYSTTAFARDRVNSFMYSYALSVAMLHRNDTAGADLPNLPSIFPEQFFDGSVFARAREEANLVEPEDRVPIEIPLDFTASDLEPEHRIAYFREDVGVNFHHWNWHVAYPHQGPPSIVAKNRRGELFYYMHQQVVSRYNFERFCNKLGRVHRLLNWQEPIEEGYFPKLDSLLASRVWPPRFSGAIMRDISRDDMEIEFDIQDLERWRDRIYEAIHAGRVVSADGRVIPLDDYNGIDILGNILEKSEISINDQLYGDLHNLGHVALALIHDPDHRHLETFAVMGSVATALRDPVFYRWHAFINDIFTQHKKTLAPYTVAQLNFEGIQVLRADVLTNGLSRPNEFTTFWQQDDINLSKGLDFTPRGPVLVRVTHLQHMPFRYFIQVNNAGPMRVGTVRIFMAPRFDERGTPLKFRDQRNFFIEMDKFQYRFVPGMNTIQRLSTDSSVTIPYERTFRDSNAEPSDPVAKEQFYYCGCGWPQHLLVPKGNAEGFPVDLFVMVSNYADDAVATSGIPNMCTNGHSLCGIRGQMYPDRKPMGYPFDRLPRKEATTLPLFLTPNMRVTPVVIRFVDQRLPPHGFLNETLLR